MVAMPSLTKAVTRVVDGGFGSSLNLIEISQIDDMATATADLIADSEVTF